MEKKQLFTISVFTENQVGLLNRISIIFTRRGLNLESVSSSASSVHGIHKMNFTCNSDRETMEKVISQIERCIDVLRAFLYTDDEIVYQEVALYKVPTQKLLDEKDFERIIRVHNARILELTREYTILEKPATRARPRPSTSCLPNTASCSSSVRAASASPSRPPNTSPAISKSRKREARPCVTPPRNKRLFLDNL